MNVVTKPFHLLAVVFALGALMFGLVTQQAAAEFKANYTTDAFAAAQADNKHIVLEVFKQGCGTCKAQQPSLSAAREQYPDAVFLSFDFVGDEAAVAKFKVVKQSTIIVFKGADEVARLIGETDKAKILGAIAQGV